MVFGHRHLSTQQLDSHNALRPNPQTPETGRLRQPLVCWKCRRLVECFCRYLDGYSGVYELRSSTSSCDLNHTLLIAVRVFLQQNGLKPGDISLESTGKGPLRLVLNSEGGNNQNFDLPVRSKQPDPELLESEP